MSVKSTKAVTVETVPIENVTKINKKLKVQFVRKINKNYGIIRMEFYPLCLCVCVRGGGGAADRLVTFSN